VLQHLQNVNLSLWMNKFTLFSEEKTEVVDGRYQRLVLSDAKETMGPMEEEVQLMHAYHEDDEVVE